MRRQVSSVLEGEKADVGPVFKHFTLAAGVYQIEFHIQL